MTCSRRKVSVFFVTNAFVLQIKTEQLLSSLVINKPSLASTVMLFSVCFAVLSVSARKQITELFLDICFCCKAFHNHWSLFTFTLQ